MPVSASGDRLARSSKARRSSSSQSMSSGANVTRPAASAAFGVERALVLEDAGDALGLAQEARSGGA